MMAFEFIAYDQAGLTLAAVTDGGVCEWIGTPAQRSIAEANIAHFEENECFLPQDEDFAPYNN